MCEKDYSLLRPFDIEAAKRGEPICCWDGLNRIYITGPDKANHLCVENPVNGRFVLAHVDNYRMSPLCWAEGRPIYHGDVLYWKYHNTCWQVTATVAGFQFDDGSVRTYESAINDEYFTWTPPEVKREAWVNIYKNSNNSYRHSTREKADNAARMVNGIIDPDRVACIHIEWEE